MKTELVITDLTRMYYGKVCIAGYDKHRRCFRPVLAPTGISENSLVQAGHAVIYPSAVVEFDLLDPYPQPPHTEDYFFDPVSPHFIRRVKSWESVLNWSLFTSVSELFDQPIYHDVGHYVLDCHGSRSVGTIKPSLISEVVYAEGVEGAWDYRLNFTDGEGKDYRLKITDLTWHYFCDSLREKGQEPPEIAQELFRLLQSRNVYLRIGLSRGWKKFPHHCFMQVNGIHTFPDYLNGKIFTDFRQNDQALREISEPTQEYEVN